MAYTVQKLATISGVSVRTLHYYDEVGLLKPAYYGANGYRYYEEEQLLLLQQILFYRKLGIELQQIQKIIAKSDFDKLSALHSHRKKLVKDLDKTKELIQTIDNTIQHLQGKKKMKDKQFFAGLNDPKQKAYEKYLIDSGKCTSEEIAQGRERLETWSKKDWKDTMGIWEQLLKDYATAAKNKKSPGSPEALDLVRRHLEYLKRFGVEIKKEELVEKSRSFLDHPDWRKVYDGYHPGLLDYVLSAIEAYAEKM